MDAVGDLYGTTYLGGDYGGGAAYELSSNGAETVLHSFAEGADGFGPVALVVDKKGNLWGTTDAGGIGGGVIFEINTKNKEKLIHTFEGSPDGCDAYGPMVADAAGDYFGTTSGCGKYNYGTVFKLPPGGNEGPVYAFRGGHDGLYPVAGLMIDAQGNLYGSTQYGGKTDACTNGFGGCGTIFKFSSKGKKTLLYQFKGPPKDGELPQGNLIADAAGNFYGTLAWGGRPGCTANEGCGAVFELAPDGKETILHFFEGGARDGGNPAAGLISDAAGDLYGTTQYGGGRISCDGATGCGTVFEIAPDGTETILHKFKGSADGANPVGGLVADAAGHLYGTTYNGGAYGYGTIFEITP